MAETDLLKINHRHEAIIDIMIAEPSLTVTAIAEKMEYTLAWVSQVINSDMFKMRLEERRAAFNATLAMERTTELHKEAKAAHKIVMAELEAAEECDPRFALDVKDKAIKSLGFGTSGAGGPQVVINNNQVDPTTLERAREKYYNAGRTIDGQAEAVPSSGEDNHGGDQQSNPSVYKEETPESRSEG